MKREEFFARELAKHKRNFDAGYELAWLEAFDLCVSNNEPVPDWARDPGLERLRKTYATAAKTASGKSDKAKSGKRGKSGKSSGRGRTGGAMAAARMNRIHYLRWALASHWLKNRKELVHFGQKPTRDGAFTLTSEMLEKTVARGAKGAIEDSYYLVEGARRRGGGQEYSAAAESLYRD